MSKLKSKTPPSYTDISKQYYENLHIFWRDRQMLHHNPEEGTSHQRYTDPLGVTLASLL